MIDISSYADCECGALTITTDIGEYNVKKENFSKFFPDIDLSNIKKAAHYYQCDHCVNRYGLDLCGCGSGEEFGKCDEDYDECKNPMQMLGKYTSISASDAWLK